MLLLFFAILWHGLTYTTKKGIMGSDDLFAYFAPRKESYCYEALKSCNAQYTLYSTYRQNFVDFYRHIVGVGTALFRVVLHVQQYQCNGQSG